MRTQYARQLGVSAWRDRPAGACGPVGDDGGMRLRSRLRRFLHRRGWRRSVSLALLDTRPVDALLAGLRQAEERRR